ncbi:MAG: hypothetical protein Q4B78_05210, partial [Bacillota bacterium]|nr:hypothetical protein [Bacillota bacterium]
MELRHISDEIYKDTNDRERMECMNELYYEMADIIKNRMPDVYRDFTVRAEDILYDITAEEARNIVRKMRPYGEHWTKDEVYSVLEDNGINPSIDYYLVMNMMYNDYGDTAKEFDVNTPE